MAFKILNTISETIKNRKSTVYIHIGTQKTGSSSIQQFLTQNRDPLKELNFIYPDLNSISSSYLVGHFGFNLPKDSNARRNTHDVKQQRAFLEERINNVAGEKDNIIISSEGFSSIWFPNALNSLNMIKSYFKNRKIKIICYLRRQDYYLESSYNQVIKAGHFDSTIQDYISKRIKIGNCDYYHLLTVYSEVFGKENIIVKTFEPKINPRTQIFHDFMDILGLKDYSKLKIPKATVNRSFSKEMIEMVNMVPQQQRRKLMRLLDKVDIGRGSEYYLTSPTERINILKHFNDSNSKVAQEFCNRNDGVLFTEPWPKPNDPWKQINDEYDPKDSIRILLDVILKQEDKALEQENRLKRIERRIFEKNKPSSES